MPLTLDKFADKLPHGMQNSQKYLADYLDDPAYDFACDWVVKNIRHARASIPYIIDLTVSNPPEAKEGCLPSRTINADGIVTYENGEHYSLEALRQIAVRQDSAGWSMTRGPVLGFIDVAIIDRQIGTRIYPSDKWAVAAIVRPTISRVERVLRDIELCRQGFVTHDRVRGHYSGLCTRGSELQYVVVSKSHQHRDVFQSQGYTFLAI